MSTLHPREPLGLVVATDDADREALCRDLSAAGYAVLGFNACGDALDWMAEETAVAAVIQVDDDRQCDALIDELRRRGAVLVFGHESMMGGGATTLIRAQGRGQGQRSDKATHAADTAASCLT